MRALPETIAYLRAMIANESVDLMLIETAELTVLLDDYEFTKEQLELAGERLMGDDL
jgi:hypothetical protein